MTITHILGEGERASGRDDVRGNGVDDLAGIIAALRTTPRGERALFVLPRRVQIDAPAARVIRFEAARQGVEAAFVTSHVGSRRALGREEISTFLSASRAERARWHRVTLPSPSRRRPADPEVVVPSGPGVFQKPSPSGFRPFEYVRSFARRPSPWWQTLGLVLATGVLLAVLLYALMAVIPAAQIVVTPDAEPIRAAVQLQAVSDARTDIEAGVVPAQTVSVQVSGEARTKTTGRRPEPAGKARGRVVFINMTNRAISIPQGSVVSTATGNNAQYGTLGATQLGPNGRAVAQVEALLPGPDGNARAGTVTRVEGPLSLSVAVSNDAAFGGGTMAPQPVVTEEDKTRLQAQLFEELKKQAFDKLVERDVRGSFISPESIDYLPLSPSFTPFVGEVSEDLFLSMSVQAVGLAVDQAEANKAALVNLQEAMPPGTRLISDTIKFIPGSVVSGKDGGVGFSVTAEGTMLRPVDTNAVRSAVLGMEPEQATSVLQQRFALARPPEITRGPDWLPYVIPLNLPTLPWRIRVVVDWDQAARVSQCDRSRPVSILPSAFDLPPGRLLALDLGQARIGAATCDEAGLLATPLTVVRRHATRAEDFAAIADIVRRERVVGVLVGMPGADPEAGGEALLAPEGEGAQPAGGGQARWTRRYAGRLAGSLDVPVAFWDETLSSVDAAELLHEARGRTGIDAAAATVILADFLEARRSKAL